MICPFCGKKIDYLDVKREWEYETGKVKEEFVTLGEEGIADVDYGNIEIDTPNMPTQPEDSFSCPKCKTILSWE